MNTILKALTKLIILPIILIGNMITNAQTFKAYKAKAEQGYAQAQGSLGVCYYEGDGVAMNKTKAVEWFQKAAEQGCIQAKEVLESITQP